MKRFIYQWLIRTVLALVCLFSDFTQVNAAWYLVGDIGGNGWTFSPQTAMTNNGDGTWSWTGAISSGTKYFAFANNTASDWGPFNSNYRFSSNGAVTLGVRAYATVQGDHTSTFSGDGSNYTITFTEIDKGFIIEKVPDTYTVAGTPTSLFGTEWDASNNANNMTETSNGVFTWSKENVELTAGTAKFKVVKNHNWDTAYPGSDYELNITSNGTYNVIITFNSDTQAVNATATAVQTTPDVYYVRGNNEAFFGSNSWGNNNNVMTTTDETNYTWTSTGQATLSADDVVEFKVVKNGSVWIPDGEGNNITVRPKFGAGNYTLTVNYVTGETPTGTLTPLFVTTPVFSPAPGTYDSNQDVTITAASGTIYYTTDGSDPTTSSTRMEYTAPIPLHHEDNFTFKAVAVDGNEVSAVAEADYTIKYVNIYLFGSVGKQHTWLYSYTNPEMTTSDGVNYYGVFDILNMPTYTARENAGLFLLTTGFGTNWETTQQYMIGTTASNNFWIDADHNYLDEWVDAAPVGQSDKGWTIIPPNGHGTYEFFYNKKENKFKLAAFDGPTIYVYDYTRPYIYVKDKNNIDYNGEMPGNPIQILDESVGGHSGLSTAADGSGLGNGTLGWYKFAVPSHDTPITFQFYHNNDKTVVPSGPLTTTGDCYYYWDGAQYVKLNSRDDAAKLRRIVAHVRVQGTTVPKCNNVEMNGPSSFYGQMYYWMAVTKYNDSEHMVITDGTHHYENTISSDIYLEWTHEQGANYDLMTPATLNDRLANKTGRGTIIHLQKNRNTPPTKDGNVVGIDTKVQDGEDWTNTTNLGTTWWGTSLESDWKGTQAWTDGVLSNYNNSRYLYMENGMGGNPDVYIVTAEDGTEWYTWYCDRSTATIRFGYGEPINGYPVLHQRQKPV